MKRSAKIAKAYTIPVHKTRNSRQQEMHMLSVANLPSADIPAMQEQIGHERGTYVRATPKVKKVKKTRAQWEAQKG